MVIAENRRTRLEQTDDQKTKTNRQQDRKK